MPESRELVKRWSWDSNHPNLVVPPSGLRRCFIEEAGGYVTVGLLRAGIEGSCRLTRVYTGQIPLASDWT